MGSARIARFGICSTACTRPCARDASPTRGSSSSIRRSITLGRRAKRENVLLSADVLARARHRRRRDRARRRRDLSRSGTMVVYPIRRLERFREVVPLVRALEGAVIAACARFGVAAERWSEHAGVWVGPQSNLRDRPCRAADGLAARHRAQRVDANSTTTGSSPLRVDRPRHHVALARDAGERSAMAEAKRVLLEELAREFDVRWLLRAGRCVTWRSPST